MNNSPKLKLTLDIAAKTTTVFLQLVIYLGAPALFCGLWYLGMKIWVGE